MLKLLNIHTEDAWQLKQYCETFETLFAELWDFVYDVVLGNSYMYKIM